MTPLSLSCRRLVLVRAAALALRGIELTCTWLASVQVALLTTTAHGFYLPGVAPREYADGDRVEIRVHKLSSPKTHLPYDYYSLPFCRPEEVMRQAENLGEVISGAVIQNSPYELYMGKSEFKVACRSELGKKEKIALSTKVKQDYRVHMIMDNLPAATKMIAEMPDGTKKDMYDRGFRLGFVGSKDIPGTEAGKAYVNNHLRFIVKYHKSETFPGARIVGFEVTRSTHRTQPKECCSALRCQPATAHQPCLEAHARRASCQLRALCRRLRLPLDLEP